MKLHLSPWRMGINPTPTLGFTGGRRSPYTGFYRRMGTNPTPTRGFTVRCILSFIAERYISSSKISYFLKQECAIEECFVNRC